MGRNTVFSTREPLIVFLMSVCSIIGMAQNKARQFNSVPDIPPPVSFTPPASPIEAAGPQVDPNVAVIEFDGNGRLWTPCTTAGNGPVCQPEYAKSLIIRAREQIPSGEQLTILTFVHGWTHNAMWDDQNFLHLREAVDCLNWGEKAYGQVYASVLERKQDHNHYDLKCTGVKARPSEHFIGIYIGWQGTPSNLSRSNLTLLPVFKTALRTAESDELRNTLLTLGSAAKSTAGTSTKPATVVLLGHSMGGLIAERQAFSMLTDTTGAIPPPPCENGRNGRTLPIDMFVLVNPANNSTVGLALAEKLMQSKQCHSNVVSDQLVSPLLISIHSNTDQWTGRTGAWGAEILSPLPKVTTPPIENDPGRTEQPPSNHELSRRTFNDSTFLLNLCYIDEDSSMTDGADASRTGDFICDRVAEKVMEAKVRENKAASLPDPTVDGIDTGAYQLLHNICDVAAEPGTLTSCTADKLALLSRQRDALNRGLNDILAFPKANVSGTPNLLFNLYTRVDPGCREGVDGLPSDRPLCLEGDSVMQPVPINKHPWNDSGYWAFNVPDSIIHGHSEFWTDNFSSILLLMAGYLNNASAP